MKQKTITIKSVKMVKPKKQDKDYDKKSIKDGIKIEKEHSPQKKIQKIISENHLDEDKYYYKKLKHIEKKKRNKK